MKRKIFYHVNPQQKFDPAKYEGEAFKFETIKRAKENLFNNIESLRSVKLKSLVSARDAMVRCATEKDSCDKPCCNLCARKYRRWHSSRIMKHAQNFELGQLYMLTVYGGTEPGGKLKELDVKKFKARFRRRVERVGLGHVPMVGGVEVSWNQNEHTWLLHCHLIAYDITEAEISLLRQVCSKDNRPHKPALKSTAVTNLMGASTYVQKFGMYHHPGARSGEARPSARPLPDARKIELFKFLNAHGFTDFLFLVNCRREGKNIVFN